MWIYHQSSGDLYHDATYEGRGYSGTGHGRDNPAWDHVEGVGPLPAGHYAIGDAYRHSHLGPCVMNLNPAPDTNTFGRSLFRIHGDSKTHNASHGCIVLGPSIRAAIAASSDRVLEVVA